MITKTQEKLAMALFNSKKAFSVAGKFTWSSGYVMPMYLDTRKLIHTQHTREIVRDALLETMYENNNIPEMICGIATGGIVPATLIADHTNKPLLYARSKPKEHGAQTDLEGTTEVAHKRVLVVEDVISTMGSAKRVIDSLKEKGAYPSLMSIFDYGFESSNRENICIPVASALTLETFLQVGLNCGRIGPAVYNELAKWQVNPFTNKKD